MFIVININKAILLLIHVTTVMGNFDLEPNFPTNPMRSVIWAISSVKWGHLGNFGLGSIFHNYYNLNCELVP